MDAVPRGRRGGAAHRSARCSDYEWSPDGTRMVLVLQDPTPEELAVRQGEEKKKNPPPWVITRRQFKHDYVGYLDSRRTHLYVLDVASKTMTQITSGDYRRLRARAGRPTVSASPSPATGRATPTATTTPTSGSWLRTTPTKVRHFCRSLRTPGPTPHRIGRQTANGSPIVSATDTAANVYAVNHLASLLRRAVRPRC